MAKKKKHDWEAIEREYRTDQFSNRELARQFNVPESTLRSRARNNRWIKDLSLRVKRKVSERLLREEIDELRKDNKTLSENDLVEQAAETRIKIIRSHNKRIGAGEEIVEVLLEQLAEAAGLRKELEDKIEELTKDDVSNQRYDSLMKAVSLAEHATIAVKLANALKVFIDLERQSFGIKNDDGEKDKDTVAFYMHESDKNL